MVEGEFVDPEYLIQLKYPMFSIADTLGMPDEVVANSALGNWGFIFTGLIVASLIILQGSLIYLMMPSVRFGIKKQMKKTKKSLFWNGTLKTIGIEYLLFLTPMVMQVKNLIYGVQTRRK